jgi:tetratricopeptide (TPR) repeat protein
MTIPVILALLLAARLAAEHQSLLPVPKPDLSRLEPAVQDQLRSMRAQADAVLARAQLSDSERASAYGELGRLYHAYDIWDVAEICYRNAASLAPRAFDWLYLLAAAQHSNGQLEDAAAQYRRCLALRQNDIRVLVRLAEVLLANGNFTEAQQLFKRALAIAPRFTPAAAGLGKSALAQRDYKGAVQWLVRALEIEPSSTSLHYPLGLAWRALGDLEKARMNLDLRGPGKPTFPDPFLDGLALLTTGKRLLWLHGWLALRSGDTSSASVAFREMIAMDPADPAGYLELARTLFQQGRLDEAQKHFSQAVILSPDSAQAHYELAVTLTRAGDHGAAALHFEQSLLLSPEMPHAHFHLANELLRQRRFEEAVRHYEQAAAADPNNALAALMGAIALTRLDRYSEARSRLQRAANAFPHNRDISVALARLIACTPQTSLQESTKAYELALANLQTQSNPDFTTAETLAMALAATGAYSKAAEVQQAIVAEVRSAGRSELVALLETNLRRYRQGLTCEAPWVDGDPIFRPEAARLDPRPTGFASGMDANVR